MHRLWIALLALALAFVCLRGGAAQYEDPAAASPRAPAPSDVPDGTPMRLADVMRRCVDPAAPRAGDAVVQTVHDPTDAPRLVDVVVQRMRREGADVTPLAPDTFEYSKAVDGDGTVRHDLKFLVYDRTAAVPGYPAEQVVKLAATLTAAPRQPPAIRSLTFATPRGPARGGPDAFDPSSRRDLARWQSPLEILRQMNFGPDAQVQT